MIYSKRPLGSVINLIPVTCSTEFPAGAVCTRITVTCPETTDLGAVYGVIQPADGVFIGTTPLMNGGGSTSVFNNGYINYYQSRGIRTVPVVWDAPGWNPSDTTGATRQNLKAAVCRCATVYRHLFDVVHFGDSSHGFCPHGHSGGAASIGYTMTDYGGDDWIDYGLMSAGPIFSNMSAGCIVPIPSNITVCPPNQNYCGQVSESFSGTPSFIDTFGSCNPALIELTGYPCACPPTISNATEIAWWNMQSIVSPDADLCYKHTALSSWLCTSTAPGTGPNNVAPEQSQYFAQNVFAQNGYTEYLIANCGGAESIWSGTYQPTGVSGLTFSADTLIENCIPRHHKKPSCKNN